MVHRLYHSARLFFGFNRGNGNGNHGPVPDLPAAIPPPEDQDHDEEVFRTAPADVEGKELREAGETLQDDSRPSPMAMDPQSLEEIKQKVREEETARLRALYRLISGLFPGQGGTVDKIWEYYARTSLSVDEVKRELTAMGPDN